MSNSCMDNQICKSKVIKYCDPVFGKLRIGYFWRVNKHLENVLNPQREFSEMVELQEGNNTLNRRMILQEGGP